MSREIFTTICPGVDNNDVGQREVTPADREAFDRLKEELQQGFLAPDSSYWPLTATEVIARNKI